MGKKKQKKLFSLTYQADISHGFSPYRLIDICGEDVPVINDFLDALATRGLSPRTLRAYGFGLLKFWSWLTQEKRELSKLTESDLFCYIRFQYAHHKGHTIKAAPSTINHRLIVAQSLYRYHTGQEIPTGRKTTKRSPSIYHRGPHAEKGYLHPCRRSKRYVRVQAPRCVVVPLKREEVVAFLESLCSWRDLSMAAFMLLCGLRSREVVELNLDDLLLSEGQIRIKGKGGKERIVPLSPKVRSVLSQYLTIERPETTSRRVFVCLKGKKRGSPMTMAGFRTIFRYHRKRSKVQKANPHRFRHTFGADMIRCGISLPALMRLMGHTNIHTTMKYIELSPKDVWEEFNRVIKKLHHKPIPRPPYAQE